VRADQLGDLLERKTDLDTTCPKARKGASVFT